MRKSAGQTLFSTIGAHGGLLEGSTWYSVLWKVSLSFLSVLIFLINFSKPALLLVLFLGIASKRSEENQYIT